MKSVLFLNKRKKIFLCLALISTIFTFSLAFNCKNDNAVLGEGCTHTKVNHYYPKEPSFLDEGINKEYWVCCFCHKKWLDSSFTDEIDSNSIVINRKTKSEKVDSLSSSYYLLKKLNESSLSNIKDHGIYLNDGNVSFFAKNGSNLNALSSFSFLDIPINTHTVSFKYKYYDINDDLYSNGYHAFASFSNNDKEITFKNDNLWHDFSISINGASSLPISINNFVGELFVSDIVYDRSSSVTNLFSSPSIFSNYISPSNFVLDVDKQVSSFESVSQIVMNKTFFDEALMEGYTHLRLNAKSNSNLINDMYLNAGGYQKVYSGNENDIRIDLNQVVKGDYSNVTLNFRDSNCNNLESNVSLSNITFYKDDITFSWEKRANTYVCFEGENLIIDSCYSGNDSCVYTDGDWYSSFSNGNVANMYFYTKYIKQLNNYRGVIYGINKTLVNDLTLGESSLLNQSYSSGDTFAFGLEKEGIISINVFTEHDYKALKAKERLSLALKDKDVFQSYFLTGELSSSNIFSTSNNLVCFSSKILGLKSNLLTDMQLARYTNIAFDFKAIPLDESLNGGFDHFVYTSDGIDSNDGWRIVYNEFDTDKISTSLHVDIDLDKAFDYSYNDEVVITIRPRRKGSENIDSTQTISSLYFYNQNDSTKTFNISLNSNGGTKNYSFKLNETFTLPSEEDTPNGIFEGWVFNNSVYKPGDVVYVNQSMDFIASYKEDLFSLKDNDYAIVYESNNNDAFWAASNLAKYIKKSLGVNKEPIEDNNYTHSTNSKVISIGNTIALQSINEVVADGKFIDVSYIKNSLLKKEDSFAISSKKKGLYLFGNNGNSLRFASTKFIEEKLDVRFFSATEEKVISKDDCLIKNGGKIYNPFFDIRTYLTKDAYNSQTQERYDYNSHFYNDSDYAASSSISNYDNAWMEGYYKDKEGKNTLINTAHNSFNTNDLGLVKLSTYSASEYPNMWFKYNDNVIDIHYSDGITDEGKIDRSTSATDNAAEAMFDSLKAVLSSYYSTHSHNEKIYLSIGQADTNECCTCSKCLSNAFKYNNSGTMIRFYNAIIKELLEDAALNDCNFKLVMFAYQYNLFSPLIHKMEVNETGLFSKSKTITGYSYDASTDTLDDTTIPNEDHLFVRVAPLVMDQYLGMEEDASYMLQRFNGRVYDETANKWVVKGSEYGDRLGHYKASILFNDWAKVTNNLMSWYYDSAFSYGYATYTGGVNRLERFIDSMKGNNFMGAFIQANFQDNVYVDTLLNAYVYQRLCWDDNLLSAIELRDEFISYYFDGESSSCIKEYYEMMDGYYEEAFKDSGYGNTFQNISKITVDNLYKAKQKLDEAYNATNDESVKGRIERLELTPMFMMAKLDENWRVHFINVFTKYGGQYVSEGHTLNDYVW